MSVPVLLFLVLMSVASCASGPMGQPTDSAKQIVLAPGESRGIPNTNLTISFEAVVEDSRCPTGVACIRAGDAIVRIRIDEPGKAPSTYTLHTVGQTGHEIEHGAVLVRLVDVTPYPTADKQTRPDEYRLTLFLDRK